MPSMISMLEAFSYLLGQRIWLIFQKLVRHEFTVKDKTDIVFSGLGWIRVQGKADQPTIVAAWAPEGVGVVVRKAIIKLNKVVKSIKRSTFYKLKHEVCLDLRQ